MECAEELFLYHNECSSSDDMTIFGSSQSESSVNPSSDEEMLVQGAKLETENKNFISIIKKFNEKEFVENFRLQRCVAYMLIEQYSTYHAAKRESLVGKPEIGAEKEFLITLRYLATTETFRIISILFGISISSAHRCITRVVKWLVKKAPLFICWPTETELKSYELKFKSIKHFPYVVGAIDGCHIKISKPKQNHLEYYNRRNFYSILLQGVVGPNQKFIDIHVGEPGNMHYSGLLKKSNLYANLTQTITNNYREILGNRVLLGNSSYPRLSWLIPPYKDMGNLDERKRAFNKMHSSTRIVTEQAFDMLKSRFRRLNSFNNLSIPLITECVAATCVLHNVCIDYNDYIAVDKSESHPVETPYFSNTNDEISGRREEIFNELCEENRI